MNDQDAIKTISDLARVAGVSPSTASRALADSPLISQATRERIQAIASQYHYRPHIGARNLRTKRTNVIVLVLPFFFKDGNVLANPYIFKIIGTIGDELRKFGYDLLVSRIHEVTPEIDSRYIHGGTADGVIILGRGDNDPLKMQALHATGIPFVVLGPTFEAQPYCSVGIDNVAGASLVVKHLAAQGRRRIGIILDHYKGEIAEPSLRFDGYRQALDDGGLAFDPNLIARSTHSAETAHAAVEQLLRQAPDIDAIFVATSDVVAIGTLQALRKFGKRVPEDVAVVGFDNIDLCNFTTPTLTSVSQRLQDGVVKILIEQLMARIKGEPDTGSVLLPAKLVVRESCGAVAVTQVTQLTHT